MKAGSNVQITTGTDGSVTIAASHLHIDGFDKDAQFLVLSATGSMNNERVFTAGTGIKTTDAGANAAYTVAIDNNIVATISGSTFTGPVKFNQGLSGSLTKIQSGLSYLVAGDNVTIASGSNGQVTISAPTPANAVDTSLRASPFVTFSASSIMSNERVLSAGPGILINTSEAGAISIESQALNLTRTKKSYNVTGSHVAGAAFSTPGIDYSNVGYSLDAIDVLLNGVLIHSGTIAQINDSEADYTLSGNSQIKFSFDLEEDDIVDTIMITSGAFSSTYASKTAPYITFGSSGDLSNERVLTAGSGISLDTSQASQVIVSANITGLRQKVSYTITGSHAANSSLTIPNVSFASGSYRDDSIDIFVNGVLMASGSNEDYVLTGDINKIRLNFSLEKNDKVTAVVQ